MRGKPKDGSKNPGGRPKKVIQQPRATTDIVFELASKSLSGEEIASILGIGRTTLYQRFSTALEKGQQACNASLRRKQYEVANEGNVTMLIWLGKQRLGQRDKHELGGLDGKPISVNVAGIDQTLMGIVSEIEKRETVQ